VALNPAWPEEDFQRLQKQTLAGIQRERVEPNTMALRVFPALLYGKQHAYGNPLTGSGTTESVSKLTTADLRKFYTTFFKPNNSVLVIVGDTTLAEIKPKLERLFGKWQGGDVPKKNIAQVARTAADPGVYLIDRPGSIQSIIFAGELAPPKNNPNEIAIETMNVVLGGNFTSRLNMNLREDKHWSYGVHSMLAGARAQRPFLAVAPVQTDKTKESISELLKEFKGILSDKPITPEELKKTQVNQTLRLPGAWETAGRVAGSIAEIVRYNLPDDYFAVYPNKVRALTQEDVRKAAQTVVHPEKMIWVVVGDRAKIESGIRELNLGELHLLDADGNPVK
jgi:zinc protease